MPGSPPRRRQVYLPATVMKTLALKQGPCQFYLKPRGFALFLQKHLQAK